MYMDKKVYAYIGTRYILHIHIYCFTDIHCICIICIFGIAYLSNATRRTIITAEQKLFIFLNF